VSALTSPGAPGSRPGDWCRRQKQSVRREAVMEVIVRRSKKRGLTARLFRARRSTGGGEWWWSVECARVYKMTGARHLKHDQQLVGASKAVGP
jgi:hypothetical protein